MTSPNAKYLVQDHDGLAELDAFHPLVSLNEGPFTALLREHERERVAVRSALQQSLAGTTARVVQVGNPLRALLTLERVLIQVARSEVGVLTKDDALLIVQAIVERQAQETRVVLLIEQAETLHPKMLRLLLTMAPHFAQEGQPTLQVVFLGHPAFLTMLNGEELAPLRMALGIREGSPVADTVQINAALIPASILERPTEGVQYTRLSECSGPDNPVAHRTIARRPTAVRLFRAMALASVELETPSAAMPPSISTVNASDARIGRLAPKLMEPLTPVSELNGAKPTGTCSQAPKTRRMPVHALLTLVVLAGAAGATYLGLHKLFYRSAPVRPALSLVMLDQLRLTPHPRLMTISIGDVATYGFKHETEHCSRRDPPVCT